MQDNEQGFGLIETLLIVLIVAVIGFGGYYVYSSNRDDSDSAAKTEQSTKTDDSKKPEDTKKPTGTTLTDEEQIIQLMRERSGSDLEIVIREIIGNNARGGIHSPESEAEAPFGASFYVHKQNGEWIWIHGGHEKPSRELGEQYGLPADWYNAN